MRSILYAFVPAIVSLLFLWFCVATSGEPCGGRGCFNDSREEITGHTDVPKGLDQKAACNCEDGYCGKEQGKEVCKCYKGWGLAPGQSLFNDPFCQKCDCRGEYNCTYTRNGFLRTLSKKCICPDGYEDKSGTCKGTCKKNPCLNGGKCVVIGDDIECQCKGAFTGNLCQTCICDGGYCEKEAGEEVCKCYKGWGLVRAASDMESDYCKKCDCRGEYNCRHANGKLVGMFKICLCPEGYEDIRGKCIGTCNKNPCLNGGDCVVKGEDIECQCKEHFSGDLCENNSQPCLSMPCYNGGQCSVVSGEVRCTCTDRFTGSLCETDKCSSVNCKNGGKCDVKNGNIFCNCTDGYTGTNCEKVDQCWEVCGVSYSKRHEEILCFEMPSGEAVCRCKDSNKIFDGMEKKCKGQCRDDICENGGTCIMYKNTTKCLCKISFSGNKCEISGRGENKTLFQFIWALCSIVILLALIIACFTVSRCRKDCGRTQDAAS